MLIEDRPLELLRYLATERPSLTKISKKLGCDPRTAARLVEGLAALGLVLVYPDGASFKAYLSDKGHKVLYAIERVVEFVYE